MKMFFTSLFAGIIWYGLFSFVVAVAFLCVVALMLAMLAGGMIAGGPLLLCWCVIRFLRRKKDVLTLTTVSAPPVHLAE